MKTRITPDNITALHPGQIFVFGSNLQGFHGGGAARLAFDKWGAVWGAGRRASRQHLLQSPPLQGGVETIRPYVDDFIRFAGSHPEMTFLVTEIGCGLPALTPVPDSAACLRLPSR